MTITREAFAYLVQSVRFHELLADDALKSANEWRGLFLKRQEHNARQILELFDKIAELSNTLEAERARTEELRRAFRDMGMPIEWNEQPGDACE